MLVSGRDWLAVCLPNARSRAHRLLMCRSRDIMASIMGAWGGALPPLEALADVSISGATLGAGHADPTLSWLSPLAELFAPCAYQGGPEAPQPPSTDWSIHLQVCGCCISRPFCVFAANGVRILGASACTLYSRGVCMHSDDHRLILRAASSPPGIMAPICNCHMTGSTASLASQVLPPPPCGRIVRCGMRRRRRSCQSVCSRLRQSPRRCW